MWHRCDLPPPDRRYLSPPFAAETIWSSPPDRHHQGCHAKSGE